MNHVLMQSGFQTHATAGECPPLRQAGADVRCVPRPSSADPLPSLLREYRLYLLSSTKQCKAVVGKQCRAVQSSAKAVQSNAKQCKAMRKQYKAVQKRCESSAKAVREQCESSAKAVQKQYKALQSNAKAVQKHCESSAKAA